MMKNINLRRLFEEILEQEEALGGIEGGDNPRVAVAMDAINMPLRSIFDEVLGESERENENEFNYTNFTLNKKSRPYKNRTFLTMDSNFEERFYK